MDNLEKLFSEHRNAIYLLFRNLIRLNKTFLLHSDICFEFNNFVHTDTGKPLKDTAIESFILNIQVAAVQSPWIYLHVRNGIANTSYYKFHLDDVSLTSVTVSEYLAFEERLVNYNRIDPWTLEIDLKPFNRQFPKMRETKSIGRGVEFLNRYLSNRLFSELEKGDERILNYLRLHQYNGRQLMLNKRIDKVELLRDNLRKILRYLEKQDAQASWETVSAKMNDLGFEAGWGRTVDRMLDTFQLLSDILEAPGPNILEEFLSRIPMIFNVVILSPHGYFGQSNVLGLPDTGGQVVYILDQVRALEKEMRQRIYEQGLDIEPQIVIITRLIPEAGETSCNQPEEDVIGARNAKIIRVPFRNEKGDIIPQWISRFKIWPYLEQFALDVEKEVLSRLRARPDLVVGNYSDGNLVASLLSQRLEITQCNIAHALEKTKYLFSALYWKEKEEQYHFSSQFTADLIAMNTADFIITSTYQEIAGNEEVVGQYESYSSFTMPELYRVVNGVDVFDPKFNIVSPGADSEVYFPYTKTEHRLFDLHKDIENLIFNDKLSYGHGYYSNKKKPIIFAMSRLDHVKNISGLVEWFGKNKELQSLANLFIVAGFIDPSLSSDEEEIAQIKKIYNLIDTYHLNGHIRWVEKQSYKNFNGELYRYIADRRGLFVQPALFEAFGLTVIEAMTSGLPTFATQNGGPLEIIVDGKSGFHIDPNRGEEAANKMADFLKAGKKDPEYWKKISQGGIKRVEARYTWKLYASRLMTLSRIYGFWKFVSNLERNETRRYLEMFYGLMYKGLVKNMVNGAD